MLDKLQPSVTLHSQVKEANACISSDMPFLQLHFVCQGKPECKRSAKDHASQYHCLSTPKLVPHQAVLMRVEWSSPNPVFDQRPKGIPQHTGIRHQYHLHDDPPSKCKSILLKGNNQNNHSWHPVIQLMLHLLARKPLVV